MFRCIIYVSILFPLLLTSLITPNFADLIHFMEPGIDGLLEFSFYSFVLTNNVKFMYVYMDELCETMYCASLGVL